MTRSLLLSCAAGLAAIVLTGASACGPDVDLSKTLQVSEVFTGWYDDGVGADGTNHMVPSISFRLKNNGTDAINRVQLTVAFWKEGADGANDEVLMQGIGPTEVAPGASSPLLLARAQHGYNLEAARADLFNQKPSPTTGSPGFVDFVIKMFAQRSGKLYRLGEFKVDRVIIPHVSR